MQFREKFKAINQRSQPYNERTKLLLCRKYCNNMTDWWGEVYGGIEEMERQKEEWNFFPIRKTHLSWKQ